MRRPIFSILLLAVVLAAAFAGHAVKLRQVAMVDLPGTPGFGQVALANGQMVITRPGTNTIEVFSPVKRRIIARISQIEDPRGIAVDDDHLRVYVALAGNNCVAAINSQNWQVEKLIPAEHPDKLLWVTETRTLYVTSTLDRTLSTVDVEGRSPLKPIDLDALPQDMLFDAARRKLLVTLQDRSEVAAVDDAGQIVERFKLNASEPSGMALDNAHRHLYVAVRFAIVVLNADNGAELLRIPAPGGTNSLVLDPSANLLYAAGGDGSVLAIDVVHNVVDHELPTDVKGYSLAYEPTHKMLFMPGGREGRSKMVILSPLPAGAQNAPTVAGNTKPADQAPKQ
jgi:DNA-binding beta-propeller fold protein YncE